MSLARPSLGFVAVCLTYGLVAAFFLWGLSSPDLDRAWRLHQALKTGQIKRLRKDDREHLQKALERHAGLGSALLDGQTIGILSAHSEGWMATPTATVLRTPESGRFEALRLEVQTPRDLLPFTVVVRGLGWRKTLVIRGRGVYRVQLPDPPPAAEVLEVRLRGQKFRADPSMLGVRVSFAEAA